MAAARPGRPAAGRRRPGRHHRQPGPVRPRLVGPAVDLSAPLLVLPPSEGKAPGGRGRYRAASGTYRALAPSRAAVIEALAAAPPEAHGVKGALLEQALAARAALVAGQAAARPAWQRYTGVVWRHLDPETLDDEQRARLAIPSGLLGLVGGRDPVPDHRLKLSVSLPGLGRLDRFWRPHVTAALARQARGRTIVDLVPAEHAAAIDWAALPSPVVRVRFVERDGRAVGHDAKAIKGRVARAILDRGLEDLPPELDGWQVARGDSEVVVRR